ncbi:MAG TPA: hypothetical protein PL112_00555, partial [Candidatus Obscuribacter sp.]|nr:hypothetical protein [Candidatus Obscuribacter sp.]
MSFNFLKKGATTNRYPTDILIGELFVKAGIITQKQLDDTIKNAATKHLHVGQMLTMAGFINHRDLQAAVDAQSMMRDKVIDMAIAARCLKIAVKTGASFDQLVKEEIAIEQQASTKTNRLGEMLMDANIINKGQFGQAMGRSLATGLPLGRILVLNNSIPDHLLRLALELQVRVRDGMMEREEALDALRAEAIKSAVEAPSEESSAAIDALKPIQKKKIRLGELLVKANFLTDTDVISCLELGLSSDRPIGEIMVDQGYISYEMLSVALAVQQVVEEDRYTAEEAAEAIKHMQNTGRIFPEIQDRINGTYVPPSEAQSSPGYEIKEPVSPRASSSKLQPLYDGPELHGDYGQNDQNAYESALDGGSMGISDDAPSLATLMRSVGGDSFDEPVSERLREPDNEKSLEQLLASAEQSAVDRASQSDDPQFQTGDRIAAIVHDRGAEEPVSSAPAKSASTGAASFEALLLRSNVVSNSDIAAALELARQTPEMFVDILKLTGYLTEAGKNAALEAYRLEKAGELDAEQSAQVLDYCINQGRLRNLTLEGAMLELGWTRDGDEVAEAASGTLAEETAEPVNGQESPSDLASVLDRMSSSLDKMSALSSSEPQQAVAEAASAPSLEELMASVSGNEAVVEQPEPTAAESDGDLLKMFGLTGEAASPVDAEQLAESGAAADALIASLATAPSVEAELAEAEAASANPTAFETTAVFKQVSEAEVDEVTSKVVDDSLSLDSLLSKLEEPGEFVPADSAAKAHMEASGSLANQGALPSVAALGVAADGAVPEPGLEDLMSSLSASLQPSSLTTSDSPSPATVSASAAAGQELSASAADTQSGGAESGTAGAAEDMDLRSLFAGLSGSGAKEQAAPQTAVETPAPEPAPAPAPAPAP